MNKEELRTYHREWKRKKRQDPVYRKKFAESVRKWRESEKGKKYIAENREKYNKKYLASKLESNRKRVLLKRQVGGTHTALQWEFCKQEHGYCCAICGIPEIELKNRWSRKEFQKLTRDHILPLSKGGDDRIKNIQPLCISCNARKRNNIVVGFTASAFDMFHSGHVEMLREAKTKCDYLIVGLHTNPQLERPSKNRPVQTTLERYLQVSGCKFVNAVIPYDTENDLLNILQTTKPDVRIIGEEYRDKSFTGKDLDIPIYFNSRQHSFSSSELRQRTCTISSTLTAR